MTWGARFPTRGHRRGMPARVALRRSDDALLIDGEPCQVDSFEGAELSYHRVVDLDGTDGWVPLLTIEDLRPHEIALVRVHVDGDRGTHAAAE